MREAGGASGAGAADVAAVQATRLAGKGIGALPAGPMDAAALPLKLLKCDRREYRGTMVLRLVLVDFVDGLRPVHHMGLDSLLLDDGLYVLVYMVVDVLTLHRRCRCLGVMGLADLSLVVV